MHPQTLRQYDRLGLVTPRRTRGRGRRYTQRDITILRRVQYMSQEEGINLEGIRRILELEARVERAEQMLRQVAEAEAARARSRHRVFAADASGHIYETATGRPVRMNYRLLPAAPSPTDVV
ncbi:hypothetical protein BM477_05865 [Boudabousia marimammalium]|uniref:HTH merR-type domain-containing protein n=2 Tax=Boudabousia marimammalium TaxID=156892 RepID=A0A1Q5PMJ4_9ACTO|nr:hypothetical protein BM477_05865 [Boudabousia marimammalium]